jgi:energy-coupling factor transporter ATP-binding protein EcfA2
MSDGNLAEPRGVSPASSGPAGPHFEAQVGASYLLALLTGGEPRGLPSMVIDRIELQRASEGRPLDDVIVHAHDASGTAAVLEIQVKREIAFSPGDSVFRDVVLQIAAELRRPDFWTTRYELAVATAKTSAKIAGPYQDVLTWARQLGSATTFIERINRPGSANDNMRTFVSTFRTRLQDAGAPHDDETIWGLLRRFQILVYDFTAPGSADESRARDRAALALHSDDAAHAATVWTELVELALRVAAAGGDRTRADLLEDFRGRPFRLAGERRHTSARRRLAEASENALADIDDSVGGAVLLRHGRLAEIRAALDTGRYVEIRGTSGVGKSGLLKHLARQMSAESPIIVLSPVRTTPRGWSHLRAVLDFDGTAPELLADLAASGGATVFIDNLNRFIEAERLTVVDLVRAASTVPGVSVVATARDGFDIDEPNWLPGDALDRLVRAAPITIGELSDAEIDELRHAAPPLAPLLADGHPAQHVTRNLFRLARLAARGAADSPRTEIDMARQWWDTADGPDDGRRRERGRVLRALADGALAGAGTVNVDNLPAAAVDALVRSESLRDFGNDRVAFRHDVLAEWAVSCLLSDLTVFDRLPLQSPAPAILARGVELTARFAIERSADSTSWQQLLERVSRQDVHGSWRRAVLLALVRSEAAADALTRASEPLLANHARLLRELIRTVKAVDVLPASRLFAALGVDPAAVPPHLNTPHGPAWFRLITWLLALGDRLPAAAIPDVASLYFDWSLSIWGRDPLTPLLLPWVYRWLSAIDNARETESAREYRAPFTDDLDGASLSDLEDSLRTTFVSFCDRTPALAASYLEAVLRRQRNERAVEAILKYRGRLAEAAPAQLAGLTLAALIPPAEEQDGRGRRRGRRRENEAFTWTDSKFIPASPAQGPFLELLIHAPQHGLPLIRQLVDHAIEFYTDGQPHGSNAFVVEFGNGPRTFPWVQSYNWSREGGGRSFAVQSALMALEAWAHKRIEAGEAFETVLADVLGTGDTPAAYLLVAVDLILSHWPASRNAAAPFLGCPELLAIDRQRWSHDVTPVPDIFGLGNLQREPRGQATLQSLKQRPSRRAMLDERLPDLAVEGPEDVRHRVAQLLRDAAARLGPYGEHDDLGDAAFMAVHAGNQLVPENYTDVEVRLRDGRTAVGKQYVAPEAERRHMERLQSARSDRSTGVNFQLAISAALEDRRQSTPEFAVSAAEWAQRPAPPPADGEENDSGLQQQAVVGAAMIAMRDLTGEQRTRYRAWAMGAFSAAVQGEDDPVTRAREGLKFNPTAIAFAGIAYAMADGAAREQAAALLALVQRPAAAHGFIAAASAVASANDRLPRAIVRCALRASIYATRQWDGRDEDRAARVHQHRRAVDAAIEAELAWLYDGGAEPPWPDLPGVRPRTRRGIRLPGGRDERRLADGTDRDAQIDRFDYQAAAAWLRGADAERDRAWLPAALRACADWTWAANGAGLESSEDLSQTPHEWNDVYFALLARDLAGADDAEVDRLALEPLASLPDESFFDALTRFQRSVDVVHFNNHGLDTASAVRIRARLAERLRASNSWRWMVRQRSSGVEMHLGPAIATLFLNDYGWTQPAKAYLPPALIDRLTPFLPSLETCAVEGATHFVAIVTLNLLEVSPRAAHLPFLLAAATSWTAAFPDVTDFWIDHGIGRRVCALVEATRLSEPTVLAPGQPSRDQVNRLLPAMVRVGVAEAARLEQALTTR